MPRVTIPDSAVAHLANLSAFVIRARRVEGHSLSRVLPDVARDAVTMKLEAKAGGLTAVSWNLPPEEMMESAAARVRPVTVGSDPVNYQKAIDAIDHFISLAGRRCDDGLAKLMSEDLLAGWTRVCDRSIGELYEVEHHNTQDGSFLSSSDSVLGWAWIYGDVVHADAEALKSTQEFGVRQRYKAAVPVVCELFRLTLATLALVRWLEAQAVVSIPTEVWEMDVTVGEAPFESIGRVFSAPAGTQPPRLGEEHGPEWSVHEGPLSVKALRT